MPRFNPVRGDPSATQEYVLAIPRSLDEITAEWLSAALAAGEVHRDSTVTSIEIETVGGGYAASLGRLSIQYRSNNFNPPTLIAKLPSTDLAIRRYAVSEGMYRREARFYRELGSHPGVPTPRCHFAADDPESGDFVLVLEDLGHLREGDELAGCSVPDAEVVVKTFGRLHATWWNDDTLRSHTWLQGAVIDPDNFDRLQALYLEAWAASADVLREIFPAETFAVAERFGPALATVLEASSAGDRTLNHGDAHLGNIFFRGDHAVFVDWQNVMVTSPALDVAYFVQGSLSVEDRRAHERNLLDVYLAALNENGVGGYTRESLIQDYRRGLLRTLIPSVLSVANLEMDSPESRELVETVGARMVGIADWDCGALIPGS